MSNTFKSQIVRVTVRFSTKEPFPPWVPRPTGDKTFGFIVISQNRDWDLNM